MEFANAQLSNLMGVALTDEEAVAQRANLCLEERITSERQETYEAHAGRPNDWADWRAAHKRYVREYVWRTRPLSAAFSGGGALRPRIEGNQELYRVERIDSVLRDYTPGAGVPVDVERVREWISSRNRNRDADADVQSPGDAAPRGAYGSSERQPYRRTAPFRRIRRGVPRPGRGARLARNDL